MNKRQKKKLYKKLHGQNPQKVPEVQKQVQPEQKQVDLSALVTGMRQFKQNLIKKVYQQ